MLLRFALTCFVVFLFASAFQAQKTVVYGRVYDALTNEPLSFAPVMFVGTKSGAQSDLDGKYRIETYYSSDSLRAMVLGYQTQTVRVRQGQTTEINFMMKEQAGLASEVVIRPDDEPNPAIAIMKKVLRNKDVNNREKLSAYEYEAYNKIEFDINNFSDKIQNRKIMRPFAFVFEGVDSTGDKPYLPVFMTESISNFHYRKNPRASKEIIHATKVSGVENESINQFLGDMYQGVNVYDNEIIVFNKSFTSPVAAYCLGFYDYGLMDSSWIDGQWCYLLQFFPRRKSERLFFGEMWINDTTYAIKRIEATIAEGANINWVRDFKVVQEFDEVEPEVWMLTRDELLVDFALSESQMGVYGRRTATYKNFVINKERDISFFRGTSNVEIDPGSGEKSDDYWGQSRHIPLSANETRVYNMVDTLKSLPEFVTFTNAVKLIFKGYKHIGIFEIGPYYTLYSFNPIEGSRFRFGGRTSNEFSKKIILDGYCAYGLRDKQFKGGGGITFVPLKNPRLAINVFAKNDLEQLGQGVCALRHDNVLSSRLRRNPANKLTYVTELSSYIEKDWLFGWSTQMIFKHRTLMSAGTTYAYLTPSSELKTTSSVPSITTTEVSIYSRFAYKERFVYGEFKRISLGTKFPVIEAQFSCGLKGVLASDFNYQKGILRVSDKIRFGPFGYIKMTTEVGRIFGNLPYPLLMMHAGNETFIYNENSYNTMNFFEFVSDEWASVWATYHAEGLFLNKIPLLRRLKWREVASGKAVIGGYDKSNDQIMIRDFNNDGVDDIFLLHKPFAEAALGIENIFKVLRIDFIWRLTYLNNPNIVRYGVRAKLQFDF